VIALAKDVFDELGQGITEKIYQAALAVALRERGLHVASEVPVNVEFHGEVVGVLRADLLIERVVVAELKAITRLTESNVAQLLAYKRRLPGVRSGLLLNFGGGVFEHRRV
jgi:GxxExxY protein